MLRRMDLISLASLAIVLIASTGQAAIVDLTTAGASGTANGGFFQQITAFPTSTGTGVIDPFLKLKASSPDIANGYNTDASPQFHEDDANTHSLLLTDTPTVTLGTDVYRQFLLDINQTGGDPLLSLHELQIFVGNSPSLTGATIDLVDGTLSFGSNAVLIYDLDLGGDGDSRVEMKANLNSGSGSGDLFAYIPDSLFIVPDASYKYVYLYSAFGNPNNNNDGFEEWATYAPASQCRSISWAPR